MTRAQFQARVMLPTLVVASLWLAPLISGARTLYLRDVFATHLPLKAAQVEAWKAGEIPLVDPYRAGGQPGLGNPNSVPLYPTNLLYLVAPVLWALNAHFWIHWLLAGAAMYWLARAWGLERVGGWASALAYACSGYFISQLNLYNAVAAAALGPAFVAASLEGARRDWPARRIAGAAALAALLLLGGEPFLALMAFAAAALAVAFDGDRRALRASSARGLIVLALAVLVASPAWLESARVLPDSFRWAARGAPADVATGSFQWAQAVEWFVPFFFGRPDRFGADGFWGYAFFQMRPPFLLALAPGLACWIAVAASGAPRSRASRWAWVLIVVGALLAWRPVAEALASLPVGSAGFRYPVRLWWLVAVGAALLVGRGAERWWADEGSARRTASTVGVTLATLALGARCAASLAAAPPELVRIAGALDVILLAVIAVLLGGLLHRRRPLLALTLISLAHLGSQLVLLTPALATDATAIYADRPALLDELPPDLAVAHAAFGRLGPWNVADGNFADDSGAWLQRRAFAEVYPAWGPVFGRRFELNPSPEGFDTALSRRAQVFLARASDADRLRVLSLWGVGRVVVPRRLGLVSEASGKARQTARFSSFGRDLHLYEPLERAAPARLARATSFHGDFASGLEAVLRVDFDPTRDAAILGSGTPTNAGPGSVRVVEESSERVEVEASSPDATHLVLTRAWMPLYRAFVDGAQVPVVVAAPDRIAVAVPAGVHRVIVETDRRPTRAAFAAAFAGLVALGVLALRSPKPA